VRINIYSQELTSDVMIVTKGGYDVDGNPATFTGVRMMLVSPTTLHHTDIDDDRSAITLWLPKSHQRRANLAIALHQMAELVESQL
jgi:hypothetical protein